MLKRNWVILWWCWQRSGMIAYDYNDFDYAYVSLPADSDYLLDYTTCPDEPDWIDYVDLQGSLCF